MMDLSGSVNGDRHVTTAGSNVVNRIPVPEDFLSELDEAF